MLNIIGIMGVIGKALKSKFVKRVVLGVTDSIPVIPTLKSNILSEDNEGGRGSIDFLRLAVAVISSLSVWAYLTGRIENIDQVIDVINTLLKNG